MLKKLRVHHFKSIEDADISLGSVNIFVGNNGTGKSNIIDAIRFLRDMARDGLDRAISDRHGIDSVRQWAPTKPYRISLGTQLTTEEFTADYTISIDSAKGLFTVFREELTMELIDDNMFGVDEDDQEARVFERTVMVRTKSGELQCTKSTLKLEEDAPPPDGFSMQWNPDTKTKKEKFQVDASDEAIVNMRVGGYSNVYRLSQLRRELGNFQAYSIYPNTLRLPQEPSSETFLTSEWRNIASVIKRMRKTKRGIEALALVTDALRTIHPNLERISVLSVGGYLVPQFHMMEPTEKRHIFNVSQMSDGTLRVLGLLIALYQEPRPAMIALEEPEQTVNPAILAVIADAIKEVSKATQVLVTTHSPHLLDQFDPADIRSVELHDGKTKVGPVSSIQFEAVRDRLFTLGELLVSEGLHS
jgi:predicted ATPase